ncbi:MAG: multidrug transporter, partial [Oceanospirillaceae bacterium]|nr:multidrug transporter [Oceanospirillaceae bacterium]
YAVKQTDIEGVDAWYLASILKLSFLVAKQGSAAFMPMADGAIYQIKINAQGIRAEPVNGSAERAVSEWQ